MNGQRDERLMAFPTATEAFGHPAHPAGRPPAPRGNGGGGPANAQYVIVNDQAIATNTIPPLPSSRSTYSNQSDKVQISGSVASSPRVAPVGSGSGPSNSAHSGQYRVSNPPNYHGDNAAYDSYYADRDSHGIPRVPSASSSGNRRYANEPATADVNPPHQNRVPTPYRPRAHNEDQLWARFTEFDRGGINKLSESDLATCLRNGDHSLFDTSTVKVIVHMFDEDGDNLIDFVEFKKLWSYLHDYREIFNQFDRDNSGDINMNEFSRALHSFGYRLSGPCIKTIFFKYSRTRRGSREPVISFDKFVLCCIHLLNITTSFKRFDYNRDGYATIGFEDYLVEVTMLRN